MLEKMIIHGLIAAILVGSGAAVYAQAKAENGYLSPAPADNPSPPTTPAAGNGYLTAPADRIGKHDGERTAKHADRERRQDGRTRDHDDDDD